MKKIELHIDRLIIDAASGPAHDRHRLARAVSQALAQRMDAQRAPASAPQSPHLEHRIAAAVHRALPGASHGGRP